MSRRYKKRPSRRGKNKPYTVHNPETARLLAWCKMYKFMTKKPRAWFSGTKWSQIELHEAYEAGLHHVAVELGYSKACPVVSVICKDADMCVIEQGRAA